MPMLDGKDEEIQAGVLADLVSIWLIGFRCIEDADTIALRVRVLETFSKVVFRIAEINEQTIKDELARSAKATKQ